MAITKKIFPNMSKTPQDSGPSFLPLFLCIGRNFSSLYRISQPVFLSAESLIKILQKIVVDILPLASAALFPKELCRLFDVRKQPWMALPEEGHSSLFNFGPGIPERHCPVKHQCLLSRVGIKAKIPLSLKLKPIARGSQPQTGFHLTPGKNP
jgi:hypothetical protein